MIVYAESSAVLSWLLGEAEGEAVRQVLATAEAVVTSELTLIEGERCLIRARIVDGLSEAASTERRDRLERTAAHWTLLTIGPEVVERARAAFPVEPIRTLDALHLATAITAGPAVSDLVVLSLDGRIRTNATKLGFSVLPTPAKDPDVHDPA
ncbi:MAG: type II toxin-antitoxin system VapC family toxin [Thermoanaerobaculia bacterium]